MTPPEPTGNAGTDSAQSPNPQSLLDGLSLNEREALLRSVTEMCEMAELAMETALLETHPASRATQIRIATPYVTQTTYSANIIRAFFTEVAFNGRPFTPDIIDTIQAALRNAVLAYDEFRAAVASELLVPEEVDPATLTLVGGWTIEPVKDGHGSEQ